jgi:hypothetical protein
MEEVFLQRVSGRKGAPFRASIDDEAEESFFNAESSFNISCMKEKTSTTC